VSVFTISERGACWQREAIHRTSRTSSRLAGMPVVLARSTHGERTAQNFGALEFTLSEADIAEFDALDAVSEPGETLGRKWW